MAARIFDKDPSAPLEKAKADVCESLISAGVSRDLVEELSARRSNLANVFDLRGLINPTYLEKATKKKFFFYVIEATRGRHGALRGLVKQCEGDLSRYVVYGTEDVVLRLHDMDTEAHLIYETLKEAEYYCDVIEVEKVHYYYRHRVRPHLSMKEIPRNHLNILAANWRSKDVTD